MKKNIVITIFRNFSKTLVNIETIFQVLCKMFVFLFTFFSNDVLISQNNKSSLYKAGIGIGTHISGDGYGGIYDLYGSLYNGKRFFLAGPCVQKRSGSVCGGRLFYAYIVTARDNFTKKENKYADDEGIQLYFFSYLQYINNAPLSFNTVEMEEKLNVRNDAQSINFNKIKLSTAEACAGFGFNLKLAKQLVWSNYIGINIFYHLNYVTGMYEDRLSSGLMLGTSIGFSFFN